MILRHSNTGGSSPSYAFSSGQGAFPDWVQLGNCSCLIGSVSSKMSIWGSGENGGCLAFRGGEFGSCEEGRDIDMISIESERARLVGWRHSRAWLCEYPCYYPENSCSGSRHRLIGNDLTCPCRLYLPDLLNRTGGSRTSQMSWSRKTARLPVLLYRSLYGLHYFL